MGGEGQRKEGRRLSQAKGPVVEARCQADRKVSQSVALPSSLCRFHALSIFRVCPCVPDPTRPQPKAQPPPAPAHCPLT